MATKTLTEASPEEVARVQKLMGEALAEILIFTDCVHPDPFDIRTVLYCPNCYALRHIEQKLPKQEYDILGKPFSSPERELFRNTQNCIVNAMNDPRVAPILEHLRDVTAQARPIMHSWGW